MSDDDVHRPSQRFRGKQSAWGGHKRPVHVHQTAAKRGSRRSAEAVRPERTATRTVEYAEEVGRRARGNELSGASSASAEGSRGTDLVVDASVVVGAVAAIEDMHNSRQHSSKANAVVLKISALDKEGACPRLPR